MPVLPLTRTRTGWRGAYKMDLLGLQKTVSDLTDKVAELETQIVKDENAIVDKILAALMPEVQQMRAAVTDGIGKACASVDQITLTVNASVTEALALARRIDGAKIILGPEVG